MFGVAACGGVSVDKFARRAEGKRSDGEIDLGHN